MAELARDGSTAEADDAKPAIKVPARPHMPREAVDFLDERLKTSKCYLEYGAGGSTRLAMRNKVPAIYSVESDMDFAREIRRIAKREQGDADVRVFVPKIGPTKAWGYPTTTEFAGKWPTYPFGIWDIMSEAGHVPDLALIDGRFRLACALTCFMNMKPGATIIFDDYVGREHRYKEIETILKPEALKDRTAVFTVPDKVPVRRMAMLLAKSVVRPE